MAEGCTCQDCGRTFTGDMLVPDDVWEKISPAPVGGNKGGGLLCPTCIVDRMVGAGLTTAVHAYPSPQDRPVGEVVVTPPRPSIDDVAQVLFEQRSDERWIDAIEADVESDAGELVSICRDDAAAVFDLFPVAAPSPAIGREREALDKIIELCLSEDAPLDVGEFSEEVFGIASRARSGAQP